MCLNKQLAYSTLRGHQYQVKCRKTTHVVPLTFGLLQMHNRKEKYQSIQVLLDSGASAMVVDLPSTKVMSKEEIHYRMEDCSWYILYNRKGFSELEATRVKPFGYYKCMSTCP